MRKRTIRDPNEIILYDDYAEIITYTLSDDKEWVEKQRLTIDLDDVDKCRKYKWMTSHAGYGRTHLNKNKKLYIYISFINIYII